VFITDTESGELPHASIPLTSRKLQDSQRTSRRLTLADPMLGLQRKFEPGLRLSPLPIHTPRMRPGKVVGARHCFILLLPGTTLLLVVPTLMRLSPLL
jgi:hypothetical protein